MEFDQLRTLLAIVEHGSFTRAAEALGISQSTVSFHVKSLEQEVGTRLLDRNRERVSLTAQGRVLERYANRLISIRQEAVSTLRAREEGIAGHVSVAASTIPGEILLPPALAKLRESHPGVSVTVDVSDSGQAASSLLARSCDLALVGRALKDRRFAVQPFAEDEVVLVGRAQGLVGADEPFPELENAPLILRKEGSGTRAAVADLLAELAARHPERPTVEVGSTEAGRRCALAGLGWVFVSRLAVEDDLEAGRLVLIDDPHLPVRRSFHLAQLRGATPSPAARALVSILLGESP